MTDTTISKVSVALSPLERKIVNDESQRRALFNFSATLRQIIREWKLAQPLPVSKEEE